MKILVLGASGMLGNALLRVMAESREHQVVGTVRSASALSHFAPALAESILTGIDAEDFDTLVSVLGRVRPDAVVNCIGLVKQLASANDPLCALPINSLLPHRLARLCELIKARLIHVSTDCVFSGRKGNYVESDQPDAEDLYGRSKLLGEVDYEHAITVRTSIIGHELSGAHGLIGWFLSQQRGVKGFRNAIFSGFPTVELSKIIRDVILPRPELRGLYHVASAPISKYGLLQLVAHSYAKKIDIEPDDLLSIDRSLSAERFRLATGYVPPAWSELVMRMRDFH